MRIARVGRLCLTVVLTVTLTTGSDANDGGIEHGRHIRVPETYLYSDKPEAVAECYKQQVEMLSQPCSILHNPGSDNARLEFEYEMFTCKLEADNRRLQARQCSGTAKECMRDMSEVTYNAFLEVQAWLHAQCQRYEVELLRDNSEKTMRKLAGNQASLLNSSVELKDALAEAQANISQFESDFQQHRELSYKAQQVLLQQTAAMEATLAAARQNLSRFEAQFQQHREQALEHHNNLINRSGRLSQSLDSMEAQFTTFDRLYSSVESGLQSIHQFHELILENLFSFKSVVFYANMLAVAYVATATTRTAAARLPLACLFVASAAAEWQLIQRAVASAGDHTATSEALRELLWQCRSASGTLGLVLLLRAFWCYEDGTLLSLAALQRIENQNSALLGELAAARKHLQTLHHSGGGSGKLRFPALQGAAFAARKRVHRMLALPNYRPSLVAPAESTDDTAEGARIAAPQTGKRTTRSRSSYGGNVSHDSHDSGAASDSGWETDASWVTENGAGSDRSDEDSEDSDAEAEEGERDLLAAEIAELAAEASAAGTGGLTTPGIQVHGRTFRKTQSRADRLGS